MSLRYTIRVTHPTGETQTTEILFDGFPTYRDFRASAHCEFWKTACANRYSTVELFHGPWLVHAIDPVDPAGERVGLDAILNESPAERERRRRIDVAYQEVKLWRVACVWCGVAHVVQSTDKPKTLPYGWTIDETGVACMRCRPDGRSRR